MVLANGAPVDGARTHWRSTSPQVDLTVLAIPGLARVAEGPVECWALEADLPRARDLTGLASHAVAHARDWWSEPESPGVTFVLTPREGGAYARHPLVVMPHRAAWAHETPALALHETGHLWWMRAIPLGPHDWLNEGLAEYSSLRLLRALGYDDAATAMVQRGTEALAGHPEDPATVETTSLAPAGHRCLYTRPMLALDSLGRRCGESALDATLRNLAHLPGPLTPEAALAVVDERLGRDARNYLRAAVATPGWKPEV